MNDLFKFGDYWDTGTMMLLLFLGCVIALLCYVGDLSQRRYNHNERSARCKYLLCVSSKWPYFVIFIILLFFFTFRSKYVGADTIEYVKFFSSSKDYVESTPFLDAIIVYEPLFLLVNYIVRVLTDSYTIYFLVCGCVIAYSFVRFFRVFWNKKRSFIYIILFVSSYYYFMNVMRFGLGTSFVMLSMCALYEKKYWKSILLTLVGALFHYTMVIQLPLVVYYYLVDKNGRTRKNRAFLLLVSGVALLAVLLPRVNTLLSSTKYQAYLRNNLDSVNILGLWNIIGVVLIACIFFYFLKGREKKTNILVISGMYNIVPLLLIIFVGAYRVGDIYSMTRISLLDEIPSRFPRNEQVIIKLLSMIIVIFFLLYKFGRYSNSIGFAYEFVWSV